MWHFDRQIGSMEKISFSVFVVSYGFALYSGIMPEHAWAIVSSSTLLLSLFSRIPQIAQNYTAKSTGHLAFVTFLLMFLGTIARAATVFFESQDVMLRAQMGLALMLNAIIVIQFALYWNNKGENHDAKTHDKPKETPKKPVPPKPDTKKNK
jgi:mannose-P-dolichol utilization defect 1